jgi:nucleoside-diphosphate-sugar epimerase
MNLLVTGATGFIGSNIVEALLAADHRVIAFSNTVPPASQRDWFKSQGNAAFICGDVRDAARLEAAIREYDVEVLVHAAVITAGAERERRDGPLIVDVNLVGAACAAMSAATTGLARFVLVGSAGAFSVQDYPAGTIVDETAPYRVETLYAVGKSAAETITRRICRLHNVPFVVGRVATAFGPWERDTGFRDTLSPIWQLTRLARSGEMARLVDKTSNWHYGRDAGTALARLATGDPCLEHYNLGPAFAWPLSAWCERLAGRYPAFRWSIASEPNIALYGDGDGGLLSWTRYEAEFGPTAQYDIDRAFADYMDWLDGLEKTV